MPRLAACTFLTLLLCQSPAVGQYVSPLKASNQAIEAKLKSLAKQEVDALGPVPYPPGYKVAFADKNPTRANTLKVQKAVYADEAIEVVRKNSDIVIIDLRLPDEFADEHIPGAINVSFVQPNQGFVRQLAKLDPSKTTLLYCDTGKETDHARLGFGVFGFKNLYAMRDGLRAWKAAGGATEGPKRGPSKALEIIPALVDPKLPPTPPASSADQVSSGPFPTIPVSYDFAAATDFVFDGHGYVSSTQVTFFTRKRANVVGVPFRTIPDARYPKEDLKHWDGIRVQEYDGGRRECFCYRANGDLLSPFFPARGNPSAVTAIFVNETTHKNERRKMLEGLGALGLHTDIYNNVWFSGYRNWTANKEASTLNLLTAKDQVTELFKGGPLKMPYGLVHDARRSLLFYSEPLEKQLWVLPVDKQGEHVGTPKMIYQFQDSEPWGVAIDQFGNLYAAAEPNVFRLKTDDTGAVVGAPVQLNQQPIERAHHIHFGHGPGFSETSLYVLSTPQVWTILADALTGYVNGTLRSDGSASRQLNNVPSRMSPLVRLDLGVRGAPETLVKIPHPAPDNEPPAPEQKKRGAF